MSGMAADRPVVQSPHETTSRLEGETLSEWTDHLTKLGSQLGVNRQCSIGYHGECSDPLGEQCRCACHPSRVARRALPLPTDPGLYVDANGDPWTLHDNGVWISGEEDDPRDYSPLIPLIAVTDEQLALHLDALNTAAWVNHHLKPEREAKFAAEWKRLNG